MAYPSKGRLSEGSRELLSRLNVAPASGRCLFSETGTIQGVALRAADIPACVEGGAVQFGITGLDLVLESDAEVVQCAALPFGFCRLVLAGPPGLTPESLQGRVVATSFPNLTRQFFESRGLDVRIVTLSGSVEAAVGLGLADAVVDLVQTGSTLRQNGLAPLADVLSSSAVLIANADAPEPGWLYA